MGRGEGRWEPRGRLGRNERKSRNVLNMTLILLVVKLLGF